LNLPSSIEDLAAENKNKTTDLFTTEHLKSSGFVEFDDVNQKVLTFCARGRHYTMWSMVKPSKLLHAITYPNIEEIKISPGIMLVVFKKRQCFVRTHGPDGDATDASYGQSPRTRRLYRQAAHVPQKRRCRHQFLMRA
jgi:hypothetical protein